MEYEGSIGSASGGKNKKNFLLIFTFWDFL
jgi:hypothetical protein